MVTAAPAPLFVVLIIISAPRLTLAVISTAPLSVIILLFRVNEVPL